VGAFVPDLLDRIPEYPYLDTVSQVHLQPWSKSESVLVGDAAYCVSPIAGQGASLAVAGAFVLANELSKSGTDLQGALARYEMRMRPTVNNVQRSALKLADWFVPDSGWRILMRTLALRTLALPGIPALLSRLLSVRNSVRL
jgi:2-polyprenyl-6-methoxyphenol hydroxylase-like FAD-dependent oxidoreductase